MSIFDKINDDIKSAMKAKERDRLEALRAVKAAFLLAKTESADASLTYEKEVQIIQKLIKQRNDAADIYKSQNRADLCAAETFQATVMSEYLPQQLSEAEIRTVVESIVAEVGATSMKDMGKVMAAANAKLAGRADGKTISTIAKSLLGS